MPSMPSEHFKGQRLEFLDQKYKMEFFVTKKMPPERSLQGAPYIKPNFIGGSVPRQSCLQLKGDAF